MTIRDERKHQYQHFHRKSYSDYRIGPESYGFVETYTYDKTGNLKARLKSIMAVRKEKRTDESGVILKALMEEAYKAGWAVPDLARVTGLTSSACQKYKPKED